MFASHKPPHAEGPAEKTFKISVQLRDDLVECRNALTPKLGRLIDLSCETISPIIQILDSEDFGHSDLGWRSTNATNNLEELQYAIKAVIAINELLSSPFTINNDVPRTTGETHVGSLVRTLMEAAESRAGTLNSGCPKENIPDRSLRSLVINHKAELERLMPKTLTPP